MRKRCEHLLRKRFGIAPVFLFKKNFSWQVNDTQIEDVVLMGDALLLLSNSYIWPVKRKYRFWVLSESHKLLISKVFKLSPQYMSVIPRELILPAKKICSDWPDFNRSSTFIISSRLDKDKNIPATIHFANELQKRFPKMKIAIFSTSDKKKELVKLLDTFSWISKPKFFGDKGFNWHRSQEFSQPFLVSLSTFLLEDFNVSVAQARELGWPIILSNWAVFREISGKSIARIDAQLFIRYENSTSKREKLKLVRQMIDQALNSSMDEEIRVAGAFKVPAILDSKTLQKIQVPWHNGLREELIRVVHEPKYRKRSNLFELIKEEFCRSHISQ